MKCSVRKFIKSDVPKRLWDDFYSDLESYIRSNTADSIYKWDQEVPETIIYGATSNISQVYELEWVKWVIFQHKMAPYSDDHLKLGSYLGLR